MMDLNQLLILMIERKGLILHLVGGSPPLCKTQENLLLPLTNDILSVTEVKTILDNALTPSQKETLEKQKELNTGYSVEGVSRFRANIFYQRGSLAAVFRLTPPTPQSLETLGLPPILKETVVKPQGLILIAGPKASGKSQTLAALLDFLLENRSIQIVSLENPIEFLLRNKKGVIYQREIGTDAPTYKQAIQTALRQNPDIMAVTEFPDFETTTEVLAAASSGILVIATIKANGVIMALEQIIEMAPPHYQQIIKSQISAGLELAVSQLLLNKKGGGTVLGLEILTGTANAKNIIREGKLQQLVSLMNNNRDQGMISQELFLRNLSKKNLIDMEEAQAKAARPEELKRMSALAI